MMGYIVLGFTITLFALCLLEYGLTRLFLEVNG